jgi:hypothetical protein
MTTIINGSSPSITFSDGSAQTSATRPFLNRIINGAMVIDQRNAGASVTPTSSEYTLDRWRVSISVTSKFSVQQNAGSVTPPAGFTNYLGVTSLSAYTVGSAELFALNHRIEGFNCADLAWGTANAKTVTLSFWVRSSLTGTFGGALLNGAGDRSYPFSYTISLANTWEQKTITIAGDTTGTWLTNNSTGINVFLSLGTGSSNSGTAGAWSGSSFYSATGATSVVGTNGATFYITGVQLEVGSTATSFDYRPYGTELNLCQRYLTVIPATSYITAYITSTTAGYCIYNPPVALRTAPTGISTSVSGNLYNGTSPASLTNLTFTAGTTASLLMTGTVASGLTLGHGSMLYTANAIQLTGCEL